MDVTIARDDKSTLRAYRAGSDGPGVVVLHAWWGLNPDIVALSNRIAGSGFRVIAPDLFDGTTAATPEDAEKLVEAADTEWERILADAERAIAHLRGEGVSKVAVLGLSFGASYALMTAVAGKADATVVFYGSAGPLDLAPDARLAPVLAHFADEDPYEPDGGQDLFEQLQAVHTPLEHYQYPGTYHWFFEPSNSHYQKDAAELAWRRTLTFLKRHLAG